MSYVQICIVMKCYIDPAKYLVQGSEQKHVKPCSYSVIHIITTQVENEG